MPHHAICRNELERLRTHPQDMALSELILAAGVRIGTNPRVSENRRVTGAAGRTALQTALAVVEAIKA